MHVANGSPLLLLLTHLRRWAEQHDRIVDVDVLEPLLELRMSYTDLSPTAWPAGSVTDLLLGLWPAKGDGDPPDPETLATSCETYFRFLRNTGRMASASADPKDLAREARRAAPQMAEVGGNRSNWSPGKALADHASQLGLDLTSAESLDDMNARLALVNTSWNSLPIHERQRLMPHPGDERISGRQRAMTAYGIDDPVVALVMSMRHELPDGPLPEPSVTAPYVRDSGLLSEVRRMLDALPSRVDVTSTGVLRPATARELHKSLGLDEWELAYERFCDLSPNRRDWRSARDLLAVNRLWTSAVSIGWIEIGATRARVGSSDLLTDDDLLDAGVRSAIAITMSLMDRWGEACGLLYALLRSYVLGCALVTWSEIGGFVDSWLCSAEQLAAWAKSTIDFTEYSIERARGEAFVLADAGVFTVDDHGLALTPLGDVFVTVLLKHLEGF